MYRTLSGQIAQPLATKVIVLVAGVCAKKYRQVYQPSYAGPIIN